MSTSVQYSFYSQCSRVIDGDTLVLDLDLGFRIQQEHSVRLLGLDCPELKTVEGKAARDYVVQWLADNGPALIVVTTQDPSDKYGRYLANVFGNGRHLNEDLLMSGHARAYNGEGPKPW